MNKKFDSSAFKKAIKEKRILESEITMDVCSKRIGIASPTLSRLENGSTPDINTFVKVINWLGHNADKYIK